MFIGFTEHHIYDLLVVENKSTTKELWSPNSTYYQDAREELEGSSVLLIYVYLERKPLESPWLAFLSVSHSAFPSVSECVSM